MPNQRNGKRDWGKVLKGPNDTSWKESKENHQAGTNQNIRKGPDNGEGENPRKQNSTAARGAASILGQGCGAWIPGESKRGPPNHGCNEEFYMMGGRKRSSQNQ